ncbi:MAG: indolepyruvate oxidoreductase subunit beta [Chloroflexi bacterium]|nr:indolepyruvate oxidoreductase subunit beta [Chloroflexota bacterium]
MKQDPLNIIVAGVGGQGNIRASEIIGTAAVQSGFRVTIGETYGAAQRGGSVMSHIRISEKSQYGPLIPEGQAHIVLGLEPAEALRVIGDFGNPLTKVIVNPRPIYPVDVLSGELKYPPVEQITAKIENLVDTIHVVETTELAKQAGNASAQNVVMVGCLAGSGWLPMRVQGLEEAIRNIFRGALIELNLQAFRLGLAAAATTTKNRP